MVDRHLKLLPSSVNVQPDSLTEDEEILSAANVADAGGSEGSDDCQVCGYSPCACEYIVKISPDGPLWELGSVAVAQMGKPFPHRPACPCPSCYSDRARSWEESICEVK